MQFEIFAEFPSPALLFPSRGTVVSQIRVGIVVKKSWHDIGGRMEQSDYNEGCIKVLEWYGRNDEMTEDLYGTKTNSQVVGTGVKNDRA
jgi:hypothetical protein